MNNTIKRTWNQNSMVIIEDLQGMAFQAESGGHTFQISGIDGEGNAVALSGTPAGVMLRADGQDVTLTCSVSGGVVSATLPANAYSVPGRFGLTIFLTSDGQKTAIYAAVGTVGKTSSGTVAPPAGSDVVTLVNQINTAIAAIPANYNACFAPAYSTSGLYSVGQYVTYNGNLYRCNTAITTAETWTAAHWTQTNLGADVYDLKSAFTSNLNWEHGALSTTTGEEVSDTVSIRTVGLLKLLGDFNIVVGSGYRIKFVEYNGVTGAFVSSGSFITSDTTFTPDITKLYRIQISLVDTRLTIDLEDAIEKVKLTKAVVDTKRFGNPFIQDNDSYLKKAIFDSKMTEVDAREYEFIKDLNWEKGAFSTTTGAEVSDTVSIRTANFIRLNGTFNIKVGSGYRIKFYVFSNDYIFESAGSFITSDQSFTPNAGKLYRIQISLVDTSLTINLENAIKAMGLVKVFGASSYFGSPFTIMQQSNNVDFYNFISAYSWEHGAFATTTGAEVDDTVSIRTKEYIRFESPFDLIIGSGYRIKFVKFDSTFNFIESGSFITEDQTFTPDTANLYRIQISLIDTRFDIDLDDAVLKNKLVRVFERNEFYQNLFEIEDGIVKPSGAVVVDSSDNNVCFESPSANGMTAVQVNDYFPFRTDRLVISDIRGNASIGLCYGDETFSNGYRLLTTRDTLTFALYVNGVKTREHTLSMHVDPVGHYLQIQHTGRAVIISVFDQEMKWFSTVGRFEFGNYTDARAEKYTTTWKTYVCAMTTSYSNDDFAAFSHYDTAIRTGENASSIRFLTYEDGSFIQKGDWLYYLVEGTAQTIQDLYTAIFKINLKTNELQMVGALFVVREDGTDEGLLLGDSSAKVLYDRNDGKWKGISCGMEYQGLGHDDDRPKLYFETTQNILDGGIVVVHGAKQLKDTNNKNVGTSETVYTEDFDFYYDSDNSYWVVIGNRVSQGAIVYHSPNLYNGYSEAFRIETVPSGVRDTGNQFVKFGSSRYITTGGSVNQLGIRAADGTYLGALTEDFPLSSNTSGQWCTLAAYNEGDRVSVYLFSFDRVDLSGEPYDHGSMYCWKAYDATNQTGVFDLTLPTSANDLPQTTNPIFPSSSPLSYTYKRKFARRDWYNAINTYGYYYLDLNTNPLMTKSDILHKLGTNFTLSYKKDLDS